MTTRQFHSETGSGDIRYRSPPRSSTGTSRVPKSSLPIQTPQYSPCQFSRVARNARTMVLKTSCLFLTTMILTRRTPRLRRVQQPRSPQRVCSASSSTSTRSRPTASSRQTLQRRRSHPPAARATVATAAARPVLPTRQASSNRFLRIGTPSTRVLPWGQARVGPLRWARSAPAPPVAQGPRRRKGDRRAGVGLLARSSGSGMMNRLSRVSRRPSGRISRGRCTS